ncbi:MAG: hypothetical protein M1816_005003 [Peltula sp. TS41687]|nr:MAG: hypothetical protein M1816_005003 [Peltula sp. TS41687]
MLTLHVYGLLNGPDGAKLSTSQKLLEALNDCFLQFEDLDKKLEPGKTRNAISRFGARALKWLFESKKIDKAVKELESYKQTISLAVQVDQAVIILDMDWKINLAKLPSAEGAAFDSYHDALDARCHPKTRLNLLRRIREWVQDPQGKCLFWLNGMAGTGKSTISRTLAQSFADKNQLGASFVFKRGEGDRGNAAKLFTAITAQLVAKMPELAPNTLEAYSDWVMLVAFSAEGKLIASGSRDRTVKLWDAATGAPHQTLEGHSDEVMSVTFLADGKLIVSGSYDRTVKLWDAATGALQQTLEDYS